MYNIKVNLSLPSKDARANASHGCYRSALQRGKICAANRLLQSNSRECQKWWEIFQSLGSNANKHNTYLRIDEGIPHLIDEL
jgi:hypothetical protein